MRTLFSTLIFIKFLHIIKIGENMEKLKIIANNRNKDTITRTIRMSGKTYDRITAVAEKNNISFNSVVNQIIEYGLKNLDS